jgi:hypothetical protein
MSGQVNIGDAGPPHEGAILEVSAETKAGGILFPHVGLVDVKEFQLPGDSTIAVGMVVYNTDKPTTNTTTVDGDGPGLYIWDWDTTVNPATLKWLPYGRGGDGGGNNLPPVGITYTVYCGGVKFIITRPADWTDEEWAELSPANNNVSATVSGGWATETVGSSYSYTVATSSVPQTVTITVGGTITVGSVTKIVEPSSATATVTQNNTGTSQFGISGIDCFDIMRTGSPTGRTKADFDVLYDYILKSALPSGASISTVSWSYTNPENAVESFTPSSAGGVHKVTVKFDKNLLDNANITATGIYVVITATVLVTGGPSPCSGGEVYTVSFSINIRDSDCCGSVFDDEKNMYTAKRFGNQCWMTQNLRSVKDRTGQPIGSVTMNPGQDFHSLGDRNAVEVSWNTVTNSLKWGNDAASVIYYYENEIEKRYSDAAGYSMFADKFGFLYPENVIVDKYKYPSDPPGKWIPNDDICPATGWRLPTKQDVLDLATVLGPSMAGKSIKANNFSYKPYRFKPDDSYTCNGPTKPISEEYTHYYLWNGYAPDDPRNSGFNLLPAGSTSGTLGSNFGLRGSFWTATKYYDDAPPGTIFNPVIIEELSLVTYATFSHFDLLPGEITFKEGNAGSRSVRCVKDMQP